MGAFSPLLSGFPTGLYPGTLLFPPVTLRTGTPRRQRPATVLGRPDGRRLAFRLVYATSWPLFGHDRRNGLFLACESDISWYDRLHAKRVNEPSSWLFLEDG